MNLKILSFTFFAKSFGGVRTEELYTSLEIARVFTTFILPIRDRFLIDHKLSTFSSLFNLSVKIQFFAKVFTAREGNTQCNNIVFWPINIKGRIIHIILF